MNISHQNAKKRRQPLSAIALAICMLAPMSTVWANEVVLTQTAEPDATIEQSDVTNPVITTTNATDNVFTLGTVRVYGAAPTAAERSESYITKEKMDLFEAKDVGTALARVPGIFYDYAQGGRYESSVNVRGYGLRYMPIFVDGIPVYIPYDGYSDMGRFTTSDLSSIQVAKGYNSVMYGHNAMGGAINILTMRPRSELDFVGVIGTGEGRTSEVSANIGSLQKNWYFQVGASHFERRYTRLAENFEGVDDAGKTVDSDKYAYTTRDHRGSIKVGWLPNATDEYVISYSKQEAQKYASPSKIGGFTPSTWKWPNWDRETLSFVSNTWVLDEQVYIKPRIYYDKFENQLVGWRGNPQGSHYDDSAFGASVELGTTLVNRHLLKLLLSYKRETHKSFNTEPNSSVRVANSYTDATQKFYSIGLEDTITLTEQFEAQLGALYTKRKAEASAIGSNTAALINAYPQARSMLAPSIDATDLQAALFYKPTDAHVFRVSIAKRTRFPSFKEVYSNYADGGTSKCLAGSTGCTPGTYVPAMSLQNPGLKPERAMHYEIGYAGTPIQGLQLDGAIFLSRSKDSIERTNYDYNTYPGYAVRQAINLDGTVERKGFEIGADYILNRYLQLGGAYTYLDVRNKDDSDIRITNTPKNFGYLYADITPIHWVHIIPSMNARSSSYYSDDGKYKNGGYAVYNLKFSVEPPIWKYVTFNVGVENLFNRNYAKYDADYASPGRYLYANMRISFY